MVELIILLLFIYLQDDREDGASQLARNYY